MLPGNKIAQLFMNSFPGSSLHQRVALSMNSAVLALCSRQLSQTQTESDGSEADLDCEEEPRDAKVDLLHRNISFPDNLILFLVLDSPSLQSSSVTACKRHPTDP